MRQLHEEVEKKVAMDRKRKDKFLKIIN
jgi:hypothetical protein